WLGNKLKPTDWSWIKRNRWRSSSLGNLRLNLPQLQSFQQYPAVAPKAVVHVADAARQASIALQYAITDEDENATYEDDLESIHSI
ncbi:hypothetical protein NQ317_017759, partial [Molorchus minor]